MSWVTTSREIVDVISLARYCRLERYKSDAESAKRLISSLNMDLQNLKSSEKLILSKLHRTKKMVEIEAHYTASRFQTIDPLQALRPVDQGLLPAPESRVGIARDKIENPKDDHTDSMKAMRAEAKRIGNEIIKTNLEIAKQKNQLYDIQKNLDPKNNGGVDLSAQMEKDAIAKRLYTEVYMLHEVYDAYRKYSTQSDGKRGFNADSINIEKLQKLSTMFQVYSKRNPYVLKGELVLDYDDPGSDDNGVKITNLLNRLLKVYDVPASETQALDSKLKKFSDLLQSKITDDYSSGEIRNAIEDPTRKQDPEKTMDKVMATQAKAVDFLNNGLSLLGLKTIKLFHMESQAKAATNWFNRTVSALNQLPLCDPAPPDEQTEQRAEQDVKAKVAEVKGGVLVSKKFEETKVKESNEIVKLPNFGLKTKEAIKNTKGKDKPAPIGFTFHLWRSIDGPGSDGVVFGGATNLYEYNVLKAADAEGKSLYSLWEGNQKSYDFYVTELAKIVQSAGIKVTFPPASTVTVVNVSQAELNVISNALNPNTSVTGQ